jgi:hypothetical protein
MSKGNGGHEGRNYLAHHIGLDFFPYLDNNGLLKP